MIKYITLFVKWAVESTKIIHVLKIFGMKFNDKSFFYLIERNCVLYFECPDTVIGM